MSGSYCLFASARTAWQQPVVWGVQLQQREWLELSGAGGKPQRPWQAEKHSWCIANWAFIRLHRGCGALKESRWLYLNRKALGRQQWHRLRRLLLLWREDRWT